MQTQENISKTMLKSDKTLLRRMILKYNIISQLFVIDKRKKERKKENLIVEIGITSAENLEKAKTEKLRKYDILASNIYLCTNLGWCDNKIPQ